MREINEKLDMLLALAGATFRREKRMANDVATILARVTAQETVIDSIDTLVKELKAHQNDPVALAAIVSQLDVNDVKLAAIANTEVPPPITPA